MVQSSRQPGADPPAPRLVVARVPSCYAVLAKGPAHIVEGRAVAVVRPSVRSLQFLARLRRPRDGRAADRFSQREEVGVVAHGGSPSLSVGAFRVGVPRRWRAQPPRFGQPPSCCCQPRGSYRFGQPICGSLATHAASRVDRYALRCAPGAESNAPRALRGPRWALKCEEPSTQRSQETCRLRTDPDASGSIAGKSACQAPARAVKPCAAVQPRAAHNASQASTVTTVPYHIEAG